MVKVTRSRTKWISRGWISRDPIGEEGGLNLYGYVENNPIRQTDPLGQFGVDEILDFVVEQVVKEIKSHFDPREIAKDKVKDGVVNGTTGGDTLGGPFISASDWHLDNDIKTYRYSFMAGFSNFHCECISHTCYYSRRMGHYASEVGLMEYRSVDIPCDKKCPATNPRPYF